MIGIGFLLLIFIWGAIALWVAKKICNFGVFTRFTLSPETGQPTQWFIPVKLVLIVFVFMLPLGDQIIAYPQWQRLCAHTGDFEYGPGMDEKKVFGREVHFKLDNHETTIFPNIKVSYMGVRVYDANTQELIFKKPYAEYSARGFFYLPSSSGDKTAPLLTSCSDYRFMDKGHDLLKKLQLKYN